MRSNWEIFWSLVILSPIAFAAFALSASLLAEAMPEWRRFRERKQRAEYNRRVRRKLRHQRISRKEHAAFGPDRNLLDAESRDVWDEWDKMQK